CVLDHEHGVVGGMAEEVGREDDGQVPGRHLIELRELGAVVQKMDQVDQGGRIGLGEDRVEERERRRQVLGLARVQGASIMLQGDERLPQVPKPGFEQVGHHHRVRRVHGLG
ncbi:hypothetical protein NGA_2062700, partial [Nannochloropsis gaditana CCMP526]|uniref:uncharacterized protein n=1 Tax=Nannochloropsis gaditana (strain CCMP526) TaxID=1093141 RepID=UPI00029F50E4